MVLKLRVVTLVHADGGDGAAISARRLHEGMSRLGHDSILFVASIRGPAEVSGELVVFKPSNTRHYWVRKRWRHLLAWMDLRPYRATRWRENSQYYPFTLMRSLHGEELLGQLPECDVINVHSVGAFMDLLPFFSEVPKRAPVVLTLHDMLFFSGGCHHSYSCEGFRHQCGACPQLGSTRSRDLSAREWERKYEAFRAVSPGRLHLVTPSRWLESMARDSSIMQSIPVVTIPHGIDVEVFQPRPREVARDILGLPRHARVLLFSAGGCLGFPGKGLRMFLGVLERVARTRADLAVLTWGGRAVQLPIQRRRNLGWIDDERLLSLVYSAGDVLLMPSRAETLPLTALAGC